MLPAVNELAELARHIYANGATAAELRAGFANILLGRSFDDDRPRLFKTTAESGYQYRVPTL